MNLTRLNLTKAELENTIETLHLALGEERAARAALEAERTTLRAQNSQLATLLLQASAQYQQLYDYVMTLRRWASEYAARTLPGVGSAAGKRSATGEAGNGQDV